jgi:hypothetical protein
MHPNRKTFGWKQKRKIAALHRSLRAAFRRTLFPLLDWSLERLSLQPLHTRWPLTVARIMQRWRVIQHRRLPLRDRQLRRRHEIPAVEILEARALLAAAFSQTGSTLNISLEDN